MIFLLDQWLLAITEFLFVCWNGFFARYKSLKYVIVCDVFPVVSVFFVVVELLFNACWQAFFVLVLLERK